MAVLTRGGNEADFDPNKMRQKEWGGVLDTKKVYYTFAPGDCRRMATHEEMTEMINESLGEIKEGFTEGVENAINTAHDSAEYATGQGNYAKDEGDYAKVQGDYAKTQGDAAASIVLGNIATPTIPGNVRGGGDIVVDQTTGDMTAPTKLDIDGDSKDNTVTFIEATTDTNIASGDSHATLFSKLSKRLHVIKDTLLTKLNIGDDYRPNLLANSDFKLWSLGTSFTFYNAAGGAGGYTADKWYIYVGTGTTATVSKVNNGLQVVTNGATQILQFLNDDKEYLNKLVGKTVTISYKLDGVVQSYTQIFQKDPTDNRIIVITFNTGTHIFEWIKLELNDHATPFIPKSYKEELLNCSDNVGYAPNLLINGDFKIWQRGETFDHTSIDGRFYTADRWCCFRSDWHPGAVVVRDGEYLKITCPNDALATYISQPIESINSRKLRGKKVTLSAKIKSNNELNTLDLVIAYSNQGEYTPGQIPSGTVIRKRISVPSEFTVFEATGVIPNNAQGVYIELAIISGGETITVEYAKLEVNDHATPFIPKTYAEELEMCQRYYFPMYGRTLRPFTIDPNTFWTHEAIPDMRITPTLLQGAKGTDWEAYGNVNSPAAGFTASLSGFYGGNNIVIAFYKPSHGLTMTNFYVSILTYKFALDAEI